MVIEPARSGWFETSRGVLLYKLVEGDFVVQTHVNAGNTADRNLAPQTPFNSAGLMARNPASASGPENYVMYNVGFQRDDVGVATEAKDTRDSVSELTFRNGFHSGVLVICRIGQTFEMWRRLDDEANWIQTNTFDRPDLPTTLQVGIVVNGFEPPVTITAEFDYVRFAAAGSLDDCTADLPPRT